MFQSLGNHEFDDGPEGLTPFLKKTLVPVVCSNIDDSSEPQLEISTLTPSRVLDINGVKVGVIGYLTPDTKVNNILLLHCFLFVITNLILIFSTLKSFICNRLLSEDIFSLLNW